MQIGVSKNRFAYRLKVRQAVCRTGSRTGFGDDAYAGITRDNAYAKLRNLLLILVCA